MYLRYWGRGGGGVSTRLRRFTVFRERKGSLGLIYGVGCRTYGGGGGGGVIVWRGGTF